jgi:hypothetical protein
MVHTDRIGAMKEVPLVVLSCNEVALAARSRPTPPSRGKIFMAGPKVTSWSSPRSQGLWVCRLNGG